jgi:hypothetical protein
VTTIIAGSRDITSMSLLEKAVSECPWNITKVFCGMARGGNTLGWQWAQHMGVPIDFFPAKWETQGSAAGPLRNQKMIDEGAEALLALWDGKSNGTRDMIQRADKAGLALHVVLARQMWVQQDALIVRPGEKPSPAQRAYWTLT